MARWLKLNSARYDLSLSVADVSRGASSSEDEVDTAGAREPLSGGTCLSGVPATGLQELCAPNDPDADVAPRSVPAHFGARHAVDWVELRVVVCPGNPECLRAL